MKWEQEIIGVDHKFTQKQSATHNGRERTYGMRLSVRGGGSVAAMSPLHCPHGTNNAHGNAEFIVVV